MRATADYHTHTIFSHGKGTIEENVSAARKKRLETIGIADHGPGHLFIGIHGVDAFRRIKSEIERLRHKYKDIEILFGVEANIVDVDGTIDVPQSIMRELDILLVGYHKMVKPRSVEAAVLGVKNFLAGWRKDSDEDLRRRNTAAILAAVRRYPIDAITHPGLQIDIDTVELARVCKEYGTFLEINSSYADELEEYIKTALPTGVKMVINSDAHTPDRVGDFEKAYKLVERLEVPAECIVNLEGKIIKRRKIGALG
jgi:putative hydrolase